MRKQLLAFLEKENSQNIETWLLIDVILKQ